MYDGKIITVQDVVFDNAADKAAWAANASAVYALFNSRGYAGYIADTGGLTLGTVGIFDDEASFLYAEGKFGANTTITGLIGKYDMTVYFGGVITPKVQARLDEWNQAPRFTCLKVPASSALGTKIGGPLKSEGDCTVLRVAFGNVADHDAYIDTMSNGATIQLIRHFETCMSFQISPTEMICVWFGQSVETLTSWLTETLPDPMMSKINEVHMPKMTTFGGYYFGNYAPIAEQLKEWPTFSPAPLVGGSLGGKQYHMVQQFYFRTKADRDAHLANLATLERSANACYVGAPVGETAIYGLHIAENAEESRKFQAIYSANAACMASTATIAACPTYICGNAVECSSDYKGWIDMFPALAVADSTNIGSIISENASWGPESFSLIQDIEWNKPGDAEKCAELMNTDEVIKAGLKHGLLWAFEKLSDTRTVQTLTFPSGQAWLDFNVSVAPHGELVGTWVKDLYSCTIGPVNKEVQAAIDAWNQAPWCNLETTKSFGVFA